MAPSNRTDSGYVLLSAIFLAMAAGGVVMVMSMVSLSLNRSAQVKVQKAQARYLSEGAVEIAKRAVQAAIANGATAPSGGTAVIDGVSVPYTIAPVGSLNVVTDPSGIQTTVQSYDIVASISIAGVTARAGRTVNAEWTPLFQYAVFFEQSLDMMPYPDMTVSGRIHTNGDLRLGTANNLTLNTNSIRVVGSLRRWAKHSGSATSGTVRIRKWVENPFDVAEPVVYEDVESLSQMTAMSIPSTSGYDSLFNGHDINSDGNYDVGAGDWLPFDAGVLQRYGPPSAYGSSGNTLLLGAHGVTRAAPPPIDSVAMFEPVTNGDYEWDSMAGEYVTASPAGSGTHNRGYFHENADIRIIVASDGLSWTAVDSSEFDVSSQLAGVVTIDQTYDKRQGGYVRVAKIDIAALNTSTVFPPNGRLYVSHYGMGTGTSSKGVHLVNGSDLLSDLTVVCEGSAYIQGDYNTTTKNSAAIVADAVNLLSNSWTNTTTMPEASSTTYNLAMISGNMETASGVYNGGLENFPRFHEDWDGETCTVNGSMISAWTNQYATGPKSAAQYSAPNRVYSYDTMFNDVTKLPPYAPAIVTVKDVARW